MMTPFFGLLFTQLTMVSVSLDQWCPNADRRGLNESMAYVGLYVLVPIESDFGIYFLNTVDQ